MSLAAQAGGIPRIIHQTWRDRNFETVRGDPDSWPRLNPDWTYRFWTDEDLDRFFETECRDCLDLYRSYDKPVQRADLARYCLLRAYGGVYADIDTRCVGSLEPLCGDARVVLCLEPDEHAEPATARGLAHLVFNGTMASPAGHPFWDDVIGKCRLMLDRRHFDVLDTTGPLILTAAFDQWPNRSQISLNSCHLFAPLTVHGDRSTAPRSGDYGHLTLSEHLWQGSWYVVKKTGWWRRKQARLRQLRHTAFGAQQLTMPAARAAIDVERLALPVADTRAPFVTVLMPVRNAERQLARSFELLLGLDYPTDRLAILFGHGDSSDRSGDLIDAFCSAHADRFAEIRSVAIQANAPRFERKRRWLPKYQYRRRAGIARARNELLASGLATAADWFLWIDADLAAYPPDVLRRLLAEGEKIVTPNCVVENGRSSFDLNTFVTVYESSRADYYRHITGGLFQPPADFWARRHLHDLRYLKRVPLEGVGGTMLLVDANVHRAGLTFPDRPYHDLIETEAFGRMARDLGITPIGLPQLEIAHTRS
ncbi:MAG: glycosyltransferase [Ancalomicrobiaceae bacterium]|nr:glycosyltransferase [Ancalomicrobiaceae bacterium]